MYGYSLQTNPEFTSMFVSAQARPSSHVHGQKACKGPVRCEGSWQARRETSLKVAALSCSLACLSKENVTSRLRYAIDNRQGCARQHYKDCHACFIHYCFLTSLSSSKSSRKPQRPVKQRAVPGPDRCPPVFTNKCPSS